MKDLNEMFNESIVNEAREWRVDNKDRLDFADLHNDTEDLVTFIEIDVRNKTLLYHSLSWANKLRNDEDDKIAEFGEELFELRSGENLVPVDGRVYIRL